MTDAMVGAMVANKLAEAIPNGMGPAQTAARMFTEREIMLGQSFLATILEIASASTKALAMVRRERAQLTGETEDYQQAEMVLAQGWERFYQNNAWSYADTSVLPPADGEEMLSEDSSASPSATLIETTIALHNAGKLSDPSLYSVALSALNRGEAQLRNNPFWYASQIGAMQLVKQ